MLQRTSTSHSSITDCAPLVVITDLLQISTRPSNSSVDIHLYSGRQTKGRYISQLQQHSLTRAVTAHA